jgi:hypothetical protein
MLEIIATIFMVSVGVTFGVVILAYAIYITFYPFARTVGGGLQVLKHFGELRARALQRDYVLASDARLASPWPMAVIGSKRKSPLRARNNHRVTYTARNNA